MKINHRGDVVPIVVIAAVALITAAILITTAPTGRPPNVPISTATSETKVSLEKGVSLALSKWAESGYSFADPKWYNNGNFPPSLAEAKESEKNFIEAEINSILSELSATRGYTFEGTPVVTFDSDGKQLDQISDNQITVKLSGITVVDTQNNAVAKNAINQELKFNYGFWGLYKKMLAWSEKDLGDFSVKLQQVFESKPYQMRGCDCGYLVAATKEETIKRGYVTWEDIDVNAIKPAIKALQDSFGANVECTYTVEEKRIENVPNIIELSSAGCSCQGFLTPSGTALTFEGEIKNTEAWATEYAGGSVPYFGIVGLSGNRAQVNTERGFSAVSDYTKVEGTVTPNDFAGNCGALSTTPVFPGGPSQKELCEQGYICTGAECDKLGDKVFMDPQGNTYGVRYGSHETVGLTKRAAAMIIVSCKDKNAKVKTEDAFKDLTTKVKVRFSIVKGAAPPQVCPTSIEGCLYVGNAVSGGSECENVDEACESSNECGICKCIGPNGQVADISGATGATDEVKCASIPGQLKCKDKKPKTSLLKDTATCNAFRVAHPDPSESCIPYQCKVISGELKMACVNILAPNTCEDCKACNVETAKCDITPAMITALKATDPRYEKASVKVGQGCNPGISGSNQECYGCTAQGACDVRPNLESYICRNDYGCVTRCSLDGTIAKCNVPDTSKTGIACPNNPDYQCMVCVVENNMMKCQSESKTCPYGCCKDGIGWGRCIASNGLCCPATKSLQKCPTAT